MAYNDYRNKPNSNQGHKSAGFDKPQATIPTIILDYIKHPNLFDEIAKEVALKISKTKSTQIRNFYDYVLDLNQQSKVKAFSEVLPFVKMLNSKVAYSKSRGHSSDEFVLMMQDCIKQVDSKEKLEIFKLFFEAVICFSKK